MLSALERDLPPETSWSRPEGGYFVWAELGVDTGELLARAADAGVAIVRGSDFFPGGRGGTTSARLAYSFVSPAEIGEGVARLAALL
jgi:DNA-binding transcriptional MocR family regulator